MKNLTTKMILKAMGFEETDFKGVWVYKYNCEEIMIDVGVSSEQLVEKLVTFGENKARKEIREELGIYQEIV